MLLALKDREWKVVSQSPNIKAELKRRDYDAKLAVAAGGNSAMFYSEGATLAGKNFVPIRLLDFLGKSIAKRVKELNPESAAK